MPHTYRERLAYRFRQQAAFANGYAPLYHHIFAIFSTWLEEEPLAPPLTWLLEEAEQRSTLEVTLLVAAALHRAVLAGAREASALTDFYPTVGGQRPATDRAFPSILRNAVTGLHAAIVEYLRDRRVQTNETGRGLSWLLPLAATPWKRVALVDLGASAGLNLVADQRAFTLTDAEGDTLFTLGQGMPPQFLTRCAGALLPRRPRSVLPVIERRLGADVAPFPLNDTADELALMSFIWADHPLRLTHLREGIAAYRRVQATSRPVNIRQVGLPDGLAPFLNAAAIATELPCLLYNTVITPYLPDKGVALRKQIDVWARQRSQPVLWIQWEHARSGPSPPDGDLFAWTADYWHNGRHRHFELAWVHPHGHTAIFRPDWTAFAAAQT